MNPQKQTTGWTVARCWLVFAGVAVGLLGARAAAAQDAPAQPQPIAVEPHQVDGVEVALMEVKRTSGETVTVKWRYRNLTDEAKEDLGHGGSGMYAWRLAVGAYLLDTKNKTKLEVVKDADGQPIAARNETMAFSAKIGPKETVNTWAKFAAPPADVKTVTVNLPGAAPFEDVTISE
ncbi:MAG TPA: hypothetical protein VIC59_05920 [Gemmatimonadota bacterium]|jgi:hypothetical protein